MPGSWCWRSVALLSMVWILGIEQEIVFQMYYRPDFCFLMCMFCADMFWSNSIQDAESCITCWLIFRQIILYLSTPSIGSKWCQWRGVITACLCYSRPRWWTNTLWVTPVRVAFVLVWLEMALLLLLKYFKLRVFEIYWWKDHRWDWVQVHYLQEFGSVVNSGEVAAMGWSTSSFHVSLDLLRFLIFFPWYGKLDILDS